LKTNKVAETRAFNAAWFKHGEFLTLTQRIGYMIFSLLFFGGGIYLAVGGIVGFRDGNPIFWLFLIVCPFFLLVGVLGLKNVLRFK
jgi:hypothetical protein